MFEETRKYVKALGFRKATFDMPSSTLRFPDAQRSASKSLL